MWRGTITLNTAVLYCLGFLVMFLFGGITGVVLAQPVLDFQLHNTYFVVAHFHYVMFGGSVFAGFAGIYYWYPKFTGRMLDERLGKLSFVVLFIGFNLTFFPQHDLGPAGHAPADRDLRRQPGVELPQHAVDHRRLHRRPRGVLHGGQPRSTPTARARSPATTPGTARRSSGRAPRRRRTTTSSRCRRSAPSVRCGTPTIPTS